MFLSLQLLGFELLPFGLVLVSCGRQEENCQAGRNTVAFNFHGSCSSVKELINEHNERMKLSAVAWHTEALSGKESQSVRFHFILQRIRL